MWNSDMTQQAKRQGCRGFMEIADNWVFFNHAGVSPLTKRARDLMKEFLDDVCAHSMANRKKWYGEIRKGRQLAADMLHCSPEEIAFMKNTSEGVSMIANGLSLSRGDSVVTTDIEYPANIYPWMRLSKSGVNLKLVANKDGRIPFEDVAAAIDKSTRVIALSSVEFSTGFRHDLKRIGEFCRERGIFFFVDGIQSVGALELDVKECRICALSAGCQKWLLGPEGVGILFVDESVLDRVEPTVVGATTVENPEEYLDYRYVTKKNAAKFECGALNVVGILGMAASMEILLEIGIPNIERHILQLTDHLCEGLLKRGYEVYSSRREGEKSGIVLLSSERHSAEEHHRRLLEKNIVTSVRYGRVRVSPHFHNTPDQIDLLLQTLP
ncbi:MAG: aminotransferase class V-fold PLP-dependent enzyme [bacterium]|nr:aminotransferase class V-fold PLP-dependent enzyme [bacterium]